MNLALVAIAVAIAMTLGTGSSGEAASNVFTDVNGDGFVNILDIGEVVADFGNPNPVYARTETYIVTQVGIFPGSAAAFCDLGDVPVGFGWSETVGSPAPPIISASKPVGGLGEDEGWIVVTDDPTSLVTISLVCADNQPLRPENEK